MAAGQADQASPLVRGSLQLLLGGRMLILGSVLQVKMSALMQRVHKRIFRETCSCRHSSKSTPAAGECKERDVYP